MNPSELPPPLPVPEADLSRTLGIARADLKKMRADHLQEGVHWTGGNGSAVLITLAGQAAFTLLLQGSEKKERGPDVQGAATAAQLGAGLLTLTVIKIGSPRVLLTRDEADEEGATIRLQVRSSALFLPGMKLERCELSPAYPDVAYYRGRYPRRKGHL